jgi:hypothetical protein
MGADPCGGAGAEPSLCDREALVAMKVAVSRTSPRTARRRGRGTAILGDIGTETAGLSAEAAPRRFF